MDQVNSPRATPHDRAAPERAERNRADVIELGRASEETRGVCGVFQDVVYSLFEPGLERD